MKNPLDEFIKIKGKMLIVSAVIPAAVFIIFFVFLYTIITHFNSFQSVYDNNGKENVGRDNNTDYDEEVNLLLNAYNLNGPDAENEEFYSMINELSMKYNSLDDENERDSRFDLSLILATLQYGKYFQKVVFDEEIIGKEIEGTGRDETTGLLSNLYINSFYNQKVLTSGDYRMFYKWSHLALGTPYSVPDLNLRGLTGNLISGRVVSMCVPKSEYDPKTDLVGTGSGTADILSFVTDREYRFTVGETESGNNSGGLLNWLLSLFTPGNKNNDPNANCPENIYGEIINEDCAMHNVTKSKIQDKVAMSLNHKSGTYNNTMTYDTIAPFVNFDQYDDTINCGGNTLVHRYIYTMHYKQYTEYLRNVFIPVNILNCEQCLYKDTTDAFKERITEIIIQNIYSMSKSYYEYAGLIPIDYFRVEGGEDDIPGDILAQISSPLVSNSCTVTSPYAFRGSMMHEALDTVVGDANKVVGKDSKGTELTGDSIVAIADGVVKVYKVYTTETLQYNQQAGYCTDRNELSNGVYLEIEHTINGKKYITKYLHLKPNSVTVKQGDTVVKGQKLAEIGTTGCSTGEHLHFEFHDVEKNTNYNPKDIFRQCTGWDADTSIPLPTTDDFYKDHKIKVDPNPNDPYSENGIFELEHYVTGVVKGEIGGGTRATEQIKAQAIAARTFAMYFTNWGKEAIENSSRNQVMAEVDVEGADKELYEIVLSTQGMFMTETSQLFMSEYHNLACQKVKVIYFSDRWPAENDPNFKKGDYGETYGINACYEGNPLKPEAADKLCRMSDDVFKRAGMVYSLSKEEHEMDAVDDLKCGFLEDCEGAIINYHICMNSCSWDDPECPGKCWGKLLAEEENSWVLNVANADRMLHDGYMKSTYSDSCSWYWKADEGDYDVLTDQLEKKDYYYTAKYNNATAYTFKNVKQAFTNNLGERVSNFIPTKLGLVSGLDNDKSAYTLLMDPYYYLQETGKLDKIPGDGIITQLYYEPAYVAHFSYVPVRSLKDQYYGHNRGMSQFAASYLDLGKGYNYKEILNEFYRSHEVLDDSDKKSTNVQIKTTELITAPALAYVFHDSTDLDMKEGEASSGGTEIGGIGNPEKPDGNNSSTEEGAIGSVSLNGANKVHSCNNENHRDDDYEKELKEFMNSFAQAHPEVSAKRAKAVAAAYWLGYNEHFYVEYDWGRAWDSAGINPKWGCKSSSCPSFKKCDTHTVGLDCQRYVRWALAQASGSGKLKSYSYHSDEIKATSCSKSGLKAKAIASVAQIGDIVEMKSSCSGGNTGHVGIVYSIKGDTVGILNMSTSKNIHLSEFSGNDNTNYSHVYSFDYFYKD